MPDGSPLAPTGVTQSRSISTATDRCRRLTDTTMRCFLRTSIKMPSRPANGLSSKRTVCPTFK